jgi:glycosyltransferase involved in cell wall biosynthesis
MKRCSIAASFGAKSDLIGAELEDHEDLIVKRPLLSVVIPTWNRARLVCEAIESALAQRSGMVQVIVVDDGSTDNTASELARRFGSNIHLLRQPRRGGTGAARNAGVRYAQGELLAFLDSDDLWLPGKLDAELEVFERFPEAEAVVSDSLTFVEQQPSEHSWFALNGLLTATQGRVRWLNECPWLWTNWQNTLAMCSITLRRNTLGRMGQPVFSEDLGSCEDWELELRLYHECRVVVLPEVWAHVRRIDDGARPGRRPPGKPCTPSQEISVLRDRLNVLERSLRLSGLNGDLLNELERGRHITAQQLAQHELIET